MTRLQGRVVFGGWMLALAATAPLRGVTTNLTALRPVPIGASGFITGIVAHPKEPLYYIRTDVGGAYRWDAAQNRWVFLLGQYGWKDGLNYWQVESIAVDPSDPDKVYVFVGGKETGLVLKSVDRGATWTATGLAKYAYGNGDWRWAGERLAVDPFNGDIIYAGTRADGLWRSTNGGTTWTKIPSIPDGDIGPDGHGFGVSFVVFDTNDGRLSDKCKVIYVGVMNASGDVYRSTDAGQTWTVVDDGGLTGYYPVRAAVSRGRLYVTYADTGNPYDDGSGRLYRCDGPTGSLVNRSPTSLALSGVSVDPNNPDRVLVTAYPANGRGTDILFRSRDGGNTWSAFGREDVYRDERPWQEHVTRPNWAGSCLIDPHNPFRAFVADGFQLWVCDNVWAVGGRTWRTRISGVETLVAFGALSVPGKGWFTFVGDKSGFRHSRGLLAYPEPGDWWNIGGEGRYASPRDFTYVGMTVTMDFCETAPEVIVRSGNNPFGWPSGTEPFAKKSTDGGRTWTPINRPQKGAGTVAVSATDPSRIVWTPINDTWNAGLWYSTDGGRNWYPAAGTKPVNSHWDIWSKRKALAADRVNGSAFYALGEVTKPSGPEINGKFFRSLDGGQTWNQTWTFTIDPSIRWNAERYKHVNVKAAPGMAGEVWVSLGPGGLHRSSDSGASFAKLPNVQECWCFGFGKGPAGRTNPSVFLIGRVEGVDGVFRSDDLGTNWVLLVPHPSPASPTAVRSLVDIVGDRDIHGVFVIATDGRGFLVGGPVPPPPDAVFRAERLLTDRTPSVISHNLISPDGAETARVVFRRVPGYKAEAWVFASDGVKVRTLRPRELASDLEGDFGEVTWDGRDDRNGRLPAGIYYLVVRMGNTRYTHKIGLR